MALQKQIATPAGITASYHKVLKVELYADRQEVEVTMAGYVNKTVYDTPDSQPLYYYAVTLGFDDFSQNPLDLVYTTLQKTEKFLDSTRID